MFYWEKACTIFKNDMNSSYILDKIREVDDNYSNIYMPRMIQNIEQGNTIWKKEKTAFSKKNYGNNGLKSRQFLTFIVLRFNYFIPKENVEGNKEIINDIFRISDKLKDLVIFFNSNI